MQHEITNAGNFKEGFGKAFGGCLAVLSVMAILVVIMFIGCAGCYTSRYTAPPTPMPTERGTFR